MKYILLVTLLALLAYSFIDNRSDEENFIEEFNNNTLIFEKIKELACVINSKNGPIRTNNLENLNNQALSDYLDELNISGIDVTEKNGKCLISLYRAGFGFGFSGYSYHYRLNVENPNFEHSSEKTKVRKGAYSYDIKLSDEWVLTFKQT
ncbi:hypothetical protein [Shewanella seohaensis]|uniref:Uncharacterized protein n=1 Tax=Shewanella seohaensis TaxID=755175 RepID=A0ABV4VVR2_9GAMM